MVIAAFHPADFVATQRGCIFRARRAARQRSARLSLALTRDIMPLGKRVQALPGNELLRDLPLELNAVGTLSGHGFHPLKAKLTLSNH